MTLHVLFGACLEAHSGMMLDRQFMHERTSVTGGIHGPSSTARSTMIEWPVWDIQADFLSA